MQLVSWYNGVSRKHMSQMKCDTRGKQGLASYFANIFPQVSRQNTHGGAVLLMANLQTCLRSLCLV
jgi:hypothetical protein